MQTLFYSLLNISAKYLKIDPYNFELYHSKLGHFLRHSVVNVSVGWQYLPLYIHLYFTTLLQISCDVM